MPPTIGAMNAFTPFEDSVDDRVLDRDIAGPLAGYDLACACRAETFSETIIVMTSDLGMREGGARTAGFGATVPFEAGRQYSAIAGALPPELFNRITATVPFSSLIAATIRELARIELDRVAASLARHGWDFEYHDDFLNWLATSSHGNR